MEVPIAGYGGQNRTNCVKAVFRDGKLDGIEVDFTTQGRLSLLPFLRKIWNLEPGYDPLLPGEIDNKSLDDGYELIDMKKTIRFGDDIGVSPPLPVPSSSSDRPLGPRFPEQSIL